MYLSFIWLLLLATLEYVTGQTTIGLCKPAASSCAALPAISAEICSELIASKSLSANVCFVPVATASVTVTKPVVIRETEVITATTTTEVTTSTYSKSRTKTLPTITALYTTKTVSRTDTKWLYTTLPKPRTHLSTVTVTTTLPATKTHSTTSKWAQQSCDAGSNKLKLRRGHLGERAALPRDCYCYLTSTSTSDMTRSTTIVDRPTVTTTLTKLTGGKFPTVTKHVTIKETTTVSTTIAAVTDISTTITKTRLSKSIATSISTRFSISPVTVPYTKTATTRTIPVSTVQVNPCGPTDYGRIEIGVPDSPELMESNEVPLPDSTNINKDCCNACYKTLGCVYWARSNDDGTCLNFQAKDSAGCSTSQCPNGFPDFGISDTDDGYSYFAGPCGSGLM
ncbi:hypothetical protein DER46DRAFT_581507 [Fusarium sp. MPI-SDFR-AT-0072]|uniref:Apple domain-containing protein n=1 Tax=Fusarium oxysporum f. sp. rapae TaxID=485398 RepID=A0A8J5NRT8_FUSOX|nr:hypothetical protein Forpe1208_v010604 [Fusarium oxysporum f. sp. rapae]KAH7143232.1 hypothetical protein DER46DRAFT_581507 [Fusarium sp. MPI-SDFR-AT-0072]KAI7760967.1 hypothetical protein LZL87_012120 [Fusarium oxysporum]